MVLDEILEDYNISNVLGRGKDRESPDVWVLYRFVLALRFYTKATSRIHIERKVSKSKGRVALIPRIGSAQGSRTIKSSESSSSRYECGRECGFEEAPYSYSYN